MDDRDDTRTTSGNAENPKHPLDDEGVTELPDREDMSVLRISPEPLVPLDPGAVTTS